jgi:hypothetical protein
MNAQPGTGDPSPDGERDTPMTGVYIAVFIVEAVIIAALWALGRMYA